MIKIIKIQEVVWKGIFKDLPLHYLHLAAILCMVSKLILWEFVHELWQSQQSKRSSARTSQHVSFHVNKCSFYTTEKSWYIGVILHKVQWTSLMAILHGHCNTKQLFHTQSVDTMSSLLYYCRLYSAYSWQMLFSKAFPSETWTIICNGD